MNLDSVIAARTAQDARELQKTLIATVEKNTALVKELIDRVASLEAKIDSKKNKKSDSAEV